MIMSISTARRLRIIVVDVDTQKHFFADTSIVCVQNYHRVLANIHKIMAWTQSEKIPVVSTIQVYNGDSTYRKYYLANLENQEKVDCTVHKRRTNFTATDCTDLPQGIFKLYDQVILEKRCFDPFEEPRADRMLSDLHAKQFILIGATIEGSVRATALGLLARGKSVTILVDAAGAYNTDTAKQALKHMWAKGAILTDTNTLLGRVETNFDLT